MIEGWLFFTEDEHGVRRVAGTSIPIDSVVIGFQRGDSPAEIHRNHPALSLEQIYGAIAYYLNHRDEVNEYLRQRQGAVEQSQSPRFNADVTTLPSDKRETNGKAAERNPPGYSSVETGTSYTMHTAPPPSSANVLQAAPSSITVAPSSVTAGPSSLTAMPTPTNIDRPSSIGGSTPTDPSIIAPTSDPTLLQIESSKRLRGYEIINKLGQGGMGAVYLARQISLDRKVAVKVLSSQLASDPSFVARFTREAYAAAQLTHHNIVQIYDIGEDSNVHYFSMEFVEGKTLHGLVKSTGRIEPAVAVNYILQAARGLKFAHDHAMIHRDIKPDNLMLNDQGMVKVADLGLVKRKGVSDDNSSMMLTEASDASVTGAAAAIGTPAYMPPEQASDAASVDLRADIYSLGCTLYDLLTGHPPFSGKTAFEVITKHANEAVIAPDKIVKDVPKSLSVILLKMMAKKPQDRYSSMGEVIKALEEYIAKNSGSGGALIPQEHHVRSLELSVNQFNTPSWAFLRNIVIWGFFGVFTLMLFLALGVSHMKGILNTLWGMHVKIAGALLGLQVLTFLCYILMSSFGQRSYFSQKLRQYFFSARPLDWIKAFLVAIILVGFLDVFRLHWVWMACLDVSFLIALLFYITVDVPLRRERRNYLLHAETMLKSMRQQGMDEEVLRLFVCTNSGERWEEFYEGLFGPVSKMSASLRKELAKRGLYRKKWHLRDSIVNTIDAMMRRREQDRQREHFARIEERKLVAQGMGAEEAKAEALKIANNIVAKAGQFREAIDDGVTAVQRFKGDIKANRLLVDELDNEVAFQKVGPGHLQRTVTGILGLLLAQQVRLVAGLLMLAVFVIWMKTINPTLPDDILQKIHVLIQQNNNEPTGANISQAPIQPETKIAVNSPMVPLTAENSTAKAANEAAEKLVHVSDQTKRRVAETENKLFGILGSWQGGLAGLILLFSASFRGLKIGLYMFAATLLILVVGRYVIIPTYGFIKAENSGMVLGTILAFCGFLFGRERRRLVRSEFAKS